MEHMYENQQPDEIDAYEDCIHVIAKSFQSPKETAEQIKQFGADFSNIALEDREYIGFLMNGVIAASPEIFDIEDPRLASNTFIHGAMTGLYVGNTMLGETMSTKDVLVTSRSMIEDGAREFYNEVLKLIEHMNPETTQILNSWRAGLGSEVRYGRFFELGFGVTMASVNKTIYEIDLFRNFENSMNGQDSGNEKLSPVALVSLDEDCLRLAQAFENHAATVALRDKTGEDLSQGMEQAAKLLEQDLAQLDDLQIDDQVQTRGLGICINFDEAGEPDEVIEYDEDLKIRGKIIRMQCMLVPTEFALFMGITDGDDIYEPQVCVILENVEAIDPDGDVTPREGISAIPLRTSGTPLDRIIYPTGKA